MAHLRCSPELNARLRVADAVVAMVGSFDGSLNFGDIAQMQTALVRVDRAVDFATRFLIVESDRLDQARGWFADDAVDRPTIDLVWFGDDESEGVPIERVPSLTLTYLYGGGYINDMWGDRKLAQVNAVDALVEGGRGARTVITGVQVSAHDHLWDWHSVISRATLRGTRDQASRQLVAEYFNSPDVTESGDDALEQLVVISSGVVVDPGIVNVHINGQPYVTASPAVRRDATIDAVATLATSHSVKGFLFHVAYADAFIDENVAVDEIIAACSTFPATTFDRQQLNDTLHPGGRIRFGSVATISSSYHVSLLSLILGIPTVLLAENTYYEHKMRGLAETFGLPESAVYNPAIGELSLLSRIEEQRQLIQTSRVPMLAAGIPRAAEISCRVAAAIGRLERDAVWETSRSVMPHYRSLIDQVVDLQRSNDEIHLALEESKRHAGDLRVRADHCDVIEEQLADLQRQLEAALVDHPAVDATPPSPLARIRRRLTT